MEVVGLAGRGAYVDAIFLKGIALILVHQFPGIFFQCWFDDIFLVVWWVIDHHSRSQGGSLVLLSRGGEERRLDPSRERIFLVIFGSLHSEFLRFSSLIRHLLQ